MLYGAQAAAGHIELAAGGLAYLTDLMRIGNPAAVYRRMMENSLKVVAIGDITSDLFWHMAEGPKRQNKKGAPLL